jgi:hypothetical protein
MSHHVNVVDETVAESDLDQERCPCGKPFKHFKGFDPVLMCDVCFECWIKRLREMS